MSQKLVALAFSLLSLIAITGCGERKKENTLSHPLIALLTDFGTQDSYVPEMKGAILSIAPQAHLIDLSHNIQPFHIGEAAYLIDRSARTFPPGTVFVIVVDPGVGSNRKPLLLQTQEGKYYIGPDNGIFSMLIPREGLHRAWVLDNPTYFNPTTISATFHGRDIFAPAAAHLIAGVSPEELGTEISQKELYLPDPTSPTLAGNTIVAEILHIDRFGNILTNIPQGFITLLKEGKLHQVTLGRKKFSAPLVRTFSDVKKGRKVLLFGSQGLLEIIANQDSAAHMLQAKVGMKVTIRP